MTQKGWRVIKPQHNQSINNIQVFIEKSEKLSQNYHQVLFNKSSETEVII